MPELPSTLAPCVEFLGEPVVWPLPGSSFFKWMHYFDVHLNNKSILCGMTTAFIQRPLENDPVILKVKANAVKAIEANDERCRPQGTPAVIPPRLEG